MKITLIIFQFVLAFNVVGQIVELCGTIESTDEQMAQKPWYYDNNYLNTIENAKDKLLSNSLQRQANFNPSLIINPISIPIRFWIYEDAANNTPIPNDRQLQVTIDRLNLLYQNNGMNVRFYMHCNQIIDEANSLVVSPLEAFNRFSGNRDVNAINIHIVNDYEGAAGVYNSIGDFIVIEQDIYQNVNNVSTLAHEIGHFFSLEHTHRNSNRGQCRQESINRNTTFTFGQFFSCFGKTGRVCQKNGDSLCDTPADPDFATNFLGDQVTNCLYTPNPNPIVMDAWGDTFTNNNVDTRNIMSVSARICRNNFSKGQVNQMWQVILFSGIRNFIVDVNVVDNFIDPDQYEPDDSDLVDVPRLIEVGETQFHSFHGFDECPDLVDWLRIDNSNGEIGSYVVEVNSVDGFTNAVEQVNVYNTDVDGNRAAKFSEITSGNGVIQIPCGTSANDYLIEVVKAEDPEEEIIQSIYTVTLSVTTGVVMTNSAKTSICTSDRYEILFLPAGATVSWSSSPSITLQVNNNKSVTVSNVVNNSPPYQISAEIYYHGCSKTISKTFESANESSLQPFEIIEEIQPCFPPISRFDAGVYTTYPPINVVWSVTSGSILDVTATEISVFPRAESFTVTASAGVNSCGTENTVSKRFTTKGYDPSLELRVYYINNETIEVEIVDPLSGLRSNGIHQVVVTNVNYVIKEQMETDENICIIDIANYNDGIYLIHAYVDDRYVVEKVFVNKVDNCSSNCTCYANISEAQLDNKTFQVAQKIISNSFNNADVVYIAGESILLETGFETHRYFDFEAKIENCQ